MKSAQNIDFKKLIGELRQLREEAIRIALDEASEATVYMYLAENAGEEALNPLLIVAMDSIVHRELLWALARALYEIEILVERMQARQKPKTMQDRELLNELKRNISLESLAETSYSDLKELAPPGTTLKAVLELLEKEEVKHRRMLERLIDSLSSRTQRG